MSSERGNFAGKRGAEKHPRRNMIATARPASPGQFLEEEAGRGRINGGIVMPDEPTFTQFKNGVTTEATGDRLTFETDVAAKEVTRGNRSSHKAGY